MFFVFFVVLSYVAVACMQHVSNMYSIIQHLCDFVCLVSLLDFLLCFASPNLILWVNPSHRTTSAPGEGESLVCDLQHWTQDHFWFLASFVLFTVWNGNTFPDSNCSLNHELFQHGFSTQETYKLDDWNNMVNQHD